VANTGIAVIGVDGRGGRIFGERANRGCGRDGDRCGGVADGLLAAADACAALDTTGCYDGCTFDDYGTARGIVATPDAGAAAGRLDDTPCDVDVAAMGASAAADASSTAVTAAVTRAAVASSTSVGTSAAVPDASPNVAFCPDSEGTATTASLPGGGGSTTVSANADRQAICASRVATTMNERILAMLFFMCYPFF
jgi:hypothetical protein